METRKTIWRSLGLASLLLLALGACGDDDKAAESDAGGNGGGSDSGMQPTDMPKADASTGGMPGGNPVTKDGGQTPTPTPTLTCDESVPKTATCGGTACAAPGSTAAMLCVVPCCVGDVCGTANTSAEMPRACTASPQPDPSCPSADVMGAIELPGCCTEGKCGVISTLTNSCITESMYVDLPEVPQPCGSGDGGTPDGGGTPGGADGG